MAQQFVKFNETRLKISVIKKYKPMGTTQLNVYFNTSRDKVEVETFTFQTEALRNEMVTKLDIIFGTWEQ